MNTQNTINDQTKSLHIGLDIGGTKIEGVALDSSGKTVASARRPSRQGNAAVIEDLSQMAHELQQQAELDGFQPVSSVGVGIPGMVDSKTGIVWDAVNLHIHNIDLPTELGNILKLPVTVENDVNAAALGASAKLHLPSMVFINLGTGLAAGVIREGNIDHGTSGAVGEIGHIPVDIHGFDCKCGQQGCLETVASGSALEKLWPQADPPLPDLIKRTEQGDTQAKAVLDMFVQGLANAVQIVALTVDPSAIIIGGGLSKVGSSLLDLVSSELEERSNRSHFISNLNLSDRLSLAPLDKPIGAIGAALAGVQPTQSSEPNSDSNINKQ